MESKGNGEDFLPACYHLVILICKGLIPLRSRTGRSGTTVDLEFVQHLLIKQKSLVIVDN